ncbi:MAG TPA: glutamyl-tRNA amidotransferase [Deltaproteobacteria bacterium]|nr:glutamyl-tRNA amidotransferase [Deltaproteobacteria bacterium]HBG72173.1 glutamyl-tRNA amidotransferase [Deltaproteobacteria bacterium]
MGLKEQLHKDMQMAAKERNSLALSALRMAMAAVRYREIDAVTRKEMPQGGTLPEEAILKVIAAMVKQRRESIGLYLQGNRPELAAKEEGEIAILERYLPKALSAEEIETAVREAIAETAARLPSDMGRVMKVLMPKVAGRADGKAVNETVRRLLAG